MVIDRAAKATKESLQAWMQQRGMGSKPISGSAVSVSTIDESNIVRLTNGDIISKPDYDALSSEDKALLNSVGINEFNALKQQAYKDKISAYQASIVTLDNGEVIEKTVYDSLSSEDKTFLNRVGIDEFNRIKRTELENFEASIVRLSNGDIVNRKDITNPDGTISTGYDNLSATDQALIMQLGVEGYNNQKTTEYNQAIEAYKASIVTLSNGDAVDKETYNALPIEEQSSLMQLGVEAYNAQKRQEVIALLKDIHGRIEDYDALSDTNKVKYIEILVANKNKQLTRQYVIDAGGSWQYYDSLPTATLTEQQKDEYSNIDPRNLNIDNPYPNGTKEWYVFNLQRSQEMELGEYIEKNGGDYWNIYKNLNSNQKEAYIKTIQTQAQTQAILKSGLDIINAAKQASVTQQQIENRNQSITNARQILAPYVDTSVWQQIDPNIPAFTESGEINYSRYINPTYDITKIPLDKLLSDAVTVNALNTIYGDKFVQNNIYPTVRSFTDEQFARMRAETNDLEPIKAAFEAAGVWDKVKRTYAGLDWRGRTYNLDWSALTPAEMALVAQYYAPRTWQERAVDVLTDVKNMFVPQAGQPVWQQALIVATDVLIVAPVIGSAFKAASLKIPALMNVPSIITKVRSPIANVRFQAPITATATKIGSESTFIELPKLGLRTPVVQTTLLPAKLQSPITMSIGQGLERLGIPTNVANAARTSANAYKEYTNILKTISKLDDITTPEFSRLSSTLKQAQTALNAADSKFIESLQGAKLNANQFKVLERTTGYNGMTNAINNVNGAMLRAGELQALLDKTAVGTKEYAQTLNELNQARTTVNKTIKELEDLLVARYTEAPSVEWMKTIAEAEDDVLRARSEYQIAQTRVKDMPNSINTERMNTAYQQLNNAENTVSSLRQSMVYGGSLDNLPIEIRELVTRVDNALSKYKNSLSEYKKYGYTEDILKTDKNLQLARMELEAIDNKFISAIQGAKLSPEELAQIEAITGYSGLSNAVGRYNITYQEFMGLVKKIDSVKVGTDEYIITLRRMSDVRQALDKELDNIKSILIPRYKSAPSTEWAEAIANAEKNINTAREDYFKIRNSFTETYGKQVSVIDIDSELGFREWRQLIGDFDEKGVRIPENVKLGIEDVYQKWQKAEATLQDIRQSMESGELFAPKTTYTMEWKGGDIGGGGGGGKKPEKPLPKDEIDRINTIRKEATREYYKNLGSKPSAYLDMETVGVAPTVSELRTAGLTGEGEYQLSMFAKFQEITGVPKSFETIYIKMQPAYDRLATIYKDIPRVAQQNIIKRLIESNLAKLAISVNAKLISNMMLVTYGELKDEFYNSIGIDSPEIHDLIYNPDITSTKIATIQQQVLDALATGQPVISQDVVLAPEQDIVVAPIQDTMVSPSTIAVGEAVNIQPRTTAQINAELRGLPEAQAEAVAQAQAQAEALAQAEAQAVSQPQVQSQRTITETKLRTEIPLRMDMGVKFKPLTPIVIIGSGTEKKELTKEQKEGAIGWKQGVMYKYIYPPFGQEDILNTPNPIEGIPIKDGIRSAYESIIRTHKGYIPPVIYRDMGIMDITITTDDKTGKPRISFKEDKHQSTKSTGKGFKKASKPRSKLYTGQVFTIKGR